MKKIFYSVVVALVLCSTTSTVNAQADIANIFKSGIADLNKVANGYLKPVGTGFSAGLGTNWYNTAEVHKTFGFDLTIGAGAAMVPTEDQMFSLAGLTNLVPTGGATQAPTFAGSGKGVELSLMQPKFLADGTTANPLYAGGTGKITSFTTPGGVFKYIPTASLQLTIGLPFINDVSVRFVPKVSVQGFETSMWGVGIKHNFKQWIPVVKALPFDASVILAYSNFDLKYAFPSNALITPNLLVTAPLTAYDGTTPASTYNGQNMNIKATAMTANIIVSKKLLFATPYIGFGVTKTNFDLTLAGTYPALGNPETQVIAGTTVPTGRMLINHMVDPVKISSGEVMPNMTIGLRLKVLFAVTFHAQYTLQKYPIASAGFGISIR